MDDKLMIDVCRARQDVIVRQRAVDLLHKQDKAAKLALDQAQTFLDQLIDEQTPLLPGVEAPQ